MLRIYPQAEGEAEQTKTLDSAVVQMGRESINQPVPAILPITTTATSIVASGLAVVETKQSA